MPGGPPATLKFLGANIQRRRRHLGFTQENLAERAGLDPRYVRTLESPRANPRVAVLVAVAEALGTSLDSLFRAVKLPRQRRPGRPPSPPKVKQHATRRRLA
jgi:transcriptional regulator with XRE-family HTH domain